MGASIFPSSSMASFVWEVIGFLTLVSFVVAPPSSATPSWSIVSPSYNQVVPPGSTLNITWSPKFDGEVTISLVEGESSTALVAGPVIAAGIDASPGAFTWAVPTDLSGTAVYGINMTLDSSPLVFQYSALFYITNSPPSSLTASSSMTTPQIFPTSSSASTSVIPPPSRSSSTSISLPPSRPTSSQSSTVTVVGNYTVTGSGTTAFPLATAGSHNSLSTAIKIGISVGAVVGGLSIVSLIALAFWYGQRVAQRKPKESDESPKEAEMKSGPGSMDGIGLVIEKQELDANAPNAKFELGEREPGELENRERDVAELEEEETRAELEEKGLFELECTEIPTELENPVVGKEF